LSLQGLIPKEMGCLDYILSGLKGNTCVNELDLTGNLLDQEDVQKILDRLEGDKLITKLKLG
jgi:hypothetical protein